ncbi:phage holin family protein [Patescibacteria group bacterium]
MFKLIANWVLNAIALYLVSQALAGIVLKDFQSAMIAILIFSLVNTLVKPILILLTLPVTIVSLGLFTFVINALLFYFVGRLTPGLSISGFGDAFWGAILYSIFTSILRFIVK